MSIPRSDNSNLSYDRGYYCKIAGNSENSLNNSRIDNNQILELQAKLSRSREELDGFVKSFDRDTDKNIHLRNRIKKIKRGVIVLRDKNITLDRSNHNLSKENNNFKKEIASLNNFIESLSPKSRENTNSQNISFSFKYYQDNHDKFNSLKQDSDYYLKLLERLKSLSSQSSQELMMNLNGGLRCHVIRWEETSEDNFGLPNENDIVRVPYQFSISKSEHGRIHGFFANDVFYVVWLDPKHLLYPSKK